MFDLSDPMELLADPQSIDVVYLQDCARGRERGEPVANHVSCIADGWAEHRVDHVHRRLQHAQEYQQQYDWKRD